MTGSALVAAAVALSPVIGAPNAPRKLSTKARVSLDARGGLGSFTPAATDPRLSAILSRNGAASSGFRFTPATTSVRLNRSVTVAVRARGNAAPRGERSALVAAPVIGGIAPVAYNLGVAVGWKRFALAGDVTKVDLGALGGREEADFGVSYLGKRWSGRVSVGADRPTPEAPRSLSGEPGYSVDVGGSYSIARNVDVTAGVRYRTIERDRLSRVIDNRGDSQAVYIGTAVKF
ncbi:MAG: hypothetical protein ACKVOP_09910 [Sphingomonadaceae bacterium]